MSSVHSRFLVNDITKNKFIWYALLICTALIALVYVLPQMRLVLDLAWMSTKIWTVAILASLLPLVLIQLYKFLMIKD